MSKDIGPAHELGMELAKLFGITSRYITELQITIGVDSGNTVLVRCECFPDDLEEANGKVLEEFKRYRYKLEEVDQ